MDIFDTGWACHMSKGRQEQARTPNIASRMLILGGRNKSNSQRQHIHFWGRGSGGHDRWGPPKHEDCVGLWWSSKSGVTRGTQTGGYFFRGGAIGVGALGLTWKALSSRWYPEKTRSNTNLQRDPTDLLVDRYMWSTPENVSGWSVEMEGHF